MHSCDQLLTFKLPVGHVVIGINPVIQLVLVTLHALYLLVQAWLRLNRLAPINQISYLDARFRHCQPCLWLCLLLFAQQSGLALIVTVNRVFYQTTATLLPLLLLMLVFVFGLWWRRRFRLTWKQLGGCRGAQRVVFEGARSFDHVVAKVGRSELRKGFRVLNW